MHSFKLKELSRYKILMFSFLFISLIADILIQTTYLPFIIQVPADHSMILFESNVTITLLGMTIITTVTTLNNGEYLGMSKLDFLNTRISLNNLFIIQFLFIIVSYFGMVFSLNNLSFTTMIISLLVILLYAKEILDFSISDSEVQGQIIDYISDKYKDSKDLEVKKKILLGIVGQNINDIYSKNYMSIETTLNLIKSLLENSKTKEEIELIEGGLGQLFTEGLDTHDLRIIVIQFKYLNEVYEIFNEKKYTSDLYNQVIRNLTLVLKILNREEQYKYNLNLIGLYNQLIENYKVDRKDYTVPVSYLSYLWKYYWSKEPEVHGLGIYQFIMWGDTIEDVDILSKINLLIKMNEHNKGDIFYRVFINLLEDPFIYNSDKNTYKNILMISLLIYWIYIESENNITNTQINSIMKDSKTINLVTDLFSDLSSFPTRLFELYIYVSNEVIPYLERDQIIWRQELDYTSTSFGNPYQQINDSLFLWTLSTMVDKTDLKQLINRFLIIDNSKSYSLNSSLETYFERYNQMFEVDVKNQYKNLMEISDSLIKEVLLLNKLNRKFIKEVLLKFEEENSFNAIDLIADKHLEKYAFHLLHPRWGNSNSNEIRDELKSTLDDSINNHKNQFYNNFLLKFIEVNGVQSINPQEFLDYIKIKSEGSFILVSSLDNRFAMENKFHQNDIHTKIKFLINNSLDSIFLIELNHFDLKTNGVKINLIDEESLTQSYLKDVTYYNVTLKNREIKLSIKEYEKYLENYLLVFDLEVEYLILNEDEMKIFECEIVSTSGLQ